MVMAQVGLQRLACIRAQTKIPIVAAYHFGNARRVMDERNPSFQQRTAGASQLNLDYTHATAVAGNGRMNVTANYGKPNSTINGLLCVS